MAQGQGLVNWSTRTRTRTFLEDNNTGLQTTVKNTYLLTYNSKQYLTSVRKILHRILMHGGGNRIYGRNMIIHNG